MDTRLVIRTSIFRDWFTVISLLLYSGAFLPLFRQSNGDEFDPATGDSTSQIIFLVIYLCSLFLIWPRRDAVWLLLKQNRWLLLLLLIALASIFWSSAPQVTLRRSMALIGTTLFGLFFVASYDLAKQARLILWTLGIALVFSVIFALFLPHLGRDVSFDGAWRGIFVHKNILGRMLALAAILSLTMIWQEGTNKKLQIGFFWGSLGVIILSNSVTAFFSIFMIIILYPIFDLLRRGVPSQLIIYFTTVTTLILILLVGFFMDEIELLLSFFGKSMTLTGRTQLWQVLMPIVERKLWLGYGYSGFWFGNAGESYLVWSRLPWHPNHAHNGLIDLVLELGLVGGGVFLITFITSFVRAIRWVSYLNSVGSLWPLCFLIYFMVANSTQSVILQTNNLFWILYVSVLLNTSYELVTVKEDLLPIDANKLYPDENLYIPQSTPMYG